jgi:membrane-associated phospholipid phosphatase
MKFSPLITLTLSLACTIDILCAKALFRDDDKPTTVAGDICQVALPIAAVGITMLAKNDNYGLIHLLRSQALTVGATYALKYTVRERRPNGGKHSFPSGHTSIAFCSAEYLNRRYGWTYGIPAFAVASFVGYSRVNAHVHHWRDVIGGAALAIGITYFFTDPFQPQVKVVHTKDFTGINVSFKL